MRTFPVVRLIAVVAVVLTVTTGCIPIVREPGGGGSGRGGGIGRADMPTSSEADKVVRGALKDLVPPAVRRASVRRRARRIPSVHTA